MQGRRMIGLSIRINKNSPVAIHVDMPFATQLHTFKVAIVHRGHLAELFQQGFFRLGRHVGEYKPVPDISMYGGQTPFSLFEVRE